LHIWNQGKGFKGKELGGRVKGKDKGKDSR
jgi:hypothetical protein